MTLPSADPRRRAAAAERNREPIVQVLGERLPGRGTVLEVGSGTGEHIVLFADRLPGLVWQPSDADPGMLESIEAWRQQPGFRFGSPPNLRTPMPLDVSDEDWPARASAAVPFPVAVLAINVLHVAPWQTAESLFSGAGEILMAGRMLILYGPFMVGGKHVGHGNSSFDKTLRRENPDWGVREMEVVQALGDANKLDLEEVVEMPANNLILVFRHR